MKGAGRRTWSDGELRDALRAAQREVGAPLSVRSYEAWRAESAQAQPDASTVRARLGGWAAAMQGAQVLPTAHEVDWGAPHLRQRLHEEAQVLSREIGPLVRQLQAGLNAEQRATLEQLEGLQRARDYRHGATRALRGVGLTGQAKRDELDRLDGVRAELQTRVEAARAELAVLGPQVSSAELLTLLRERDDARRQLGALQQRLAADMTTASDAVLARRLTTISNRERWVLLAHFRKRLSDPDRFGLALPMPEVFALDDRHHDLPVLGHTRRGTPVKVLEVEGQEVFALLTPDTEDVLTLTTAYTREMWQGSEGRPF